MKLHLETGEGEISSAYFTIINITQADITHLEGQIQVITTASTGQITNSPIQFGNLLLQESRTKYSCCNCSQHRATEKKSNFAM